MVRRHFDRCYPHWWQPVRSPCTTHGWDAGQIGTSLDSSESIAMTVRNNQGVNNHIMFCIYSIYIYTYIILTDRYIYVKYVCKWWLNKRWWVQPIFFGSLGILKFKRFVQVGSQVKTSPEHFDDHFDLTFWFDIFDDLELFWLPYIAMVCFFVQVDKILGIHVSAKEVPFVKCRVGPVGTWWDHDPRVDILWMVGKSCTS